MTTIHDVQSLRHAAIRRYLVARDGINQSYKRRVLGTLLVIFAAVVLCVVLLLRLDAR